MRRFVLLAALLAVLAGAAAGEAVSVTARPSATEVTPGRVFTVEVTATGPAGTQWTFPAQANSEHVDLEIQPPPAKAPAPPGTATYRGAVFALGEAELPAITVQYRLPSGETGSVATAPVKLVVGSALPRGEENPQPADLRPPVKLAIGTAFWVALALTLALAAAAVRWLIRRRRKPAEAAAPPVPEVSPEEEARLALDRLATSGLVEREEFRRYYIELTAIAKRYLERRLGSPVLEMTSAEVAALLRDHPLAGPHLPAMRDLLGAADWVKFARGTARGEAAAQHLASVRGMVAAVEETLQAQARVAKEAA
ncbi:MAG TPA: hypothetical protein P5234_03680 [Thermoanaerobaculaceae bacterium]|nr:hypothetical protein [Thermoanaerobaculaceae bacterium]HRS15332.1 hypothetical protein [Thermoanaerobaculaceae bacterium]